MVYRIRIVVPLILLLAITLSCGGSSEDSSESRMGSPRDEDLPKASAVNRNHIVWHDYDEGMMELVGSTKFGILYFDTTDCEPCNWMDSVFNVPEVAEEINKYFIPIRIQTARNDTVHYQGMPFTESHMRKLFMLAGYPTTIFIEGRRNMMISARAGRIPSDDLLQYFGYLTSLAYKVVEYDEYLENREREKQRQGR
jgi:thioredoxin-related protein